MVPHDRLWYPYHISTKTYNYTQTYITQLHSYGRYIKGVPTNTNKILVHFTMFSKMLYGGPEKHFYTVSDQIKVITDPTNWK